MSDRTPREQTTREKTERKKEWKPTAKLDAPPAPDGFQHRWVRVETRGQGDPGNVHSRMRQHYEVVQASEYADSHPDLDKVEEGKHTGVIRSGDLILTRVPVEVAEQRNKHFQERTDRTQEAIDNELAAHQSDVMPFQSERRTRVFRGAGRPKANA